MLVALVVVVVVVVFVVVVVAVVVVVVVVSVVAGASFRLVWRMQPSPGAPAVARRRFWFPTSVAAHDGGKPGQGPRHPHVEAAQEDRGRHCAGQCDAAHGSCRPHGG